MMSEPRFYICEKCGNYMDSTEALVFKPEIHYELPEKPTEWVASLQCIYCGCEDLEPADYCDSCEDVFPLSELSDGFCPKCNRVRERMSERLVKV